MKYNLTIKALGKQPEVDITAKEFDSYRVARKILTNALTFEEKYEIVLTNYTDFEREALLLTNEAMIRAFDCPDFFDIRVRLNIKIVNLVTATRLYVDQIGSNVRNCLPGEKDVLQTVKAKFSAAYDSSLDYQFMEQLRNYVQHKAMPVHYTKHLSSWVPPKKHEYLEFGLAVLADRSRLAEDPKFKKSVLKQLPERIDVRQASRGYVERLSEVHLEIRSWISTEVDASAQLLKDADLQFQALHTGSNTRLYACKWDGQELIDSVPIQLRWDEERTRLERRNRELVNLSKRYSTSWSDPMSEKV